MERPSPVAEQRRLEALVGRWEAIEEWIPSHLHPPESRRAVGRLTFRSVLDGFGLLQTYVHVDGGAATYRTLGVLRWDEGRACYVLTLFQSTGHRPQHYTGTFEGDDELVLESEGRPGGRLRTTLTLGEKSFILRLEMDLKEDEWVPLMRARYRPVDGEPGASAGP